MAKEIYRSYLLVLEYGKEKIEIDFSKIKEYKKLKANKYKLDQIDAFTSKFRSPDDLKIRLITENIIEKNKASKGVFRVYPVKRDKLEQFINGKVKTKEVVEYADESLDGIIFSQYENLITNEMALIHLIEEKVNNLDFMTKLNEKYRRMPQYSRGNIAYIESKLEEIEQQMRYNNDYKLEAIRKSYLKQLSDIKQTIGILDELLVYSKMINNGEYLGNEARNSLSNGVREFVLRQKYYVESYREGINDNRLLTYKLNKDGNRTQSYPKYCDLVTFVINYLEEENIRKKMEEQYEYEGSQITLWDIEGFGIETKKSR